MPRGRRSLGKSLIPWQGRPLWSPEGEAIKNAGIHQRIPYRHAIAQLFQLVDIIQQNKLAPTVDNFPSIHSIHRLVHSHPGEKPLENRDFARLRQNLYTAIHILGVTCSPVYRIPFFPQTQSPCRKTDLPAGACFSPKISGIWPAARTPAPGAPGHCGSLPAPRCHPPPVPTAGPASLPLLPQRHS